MLRPSAPPPIGVAMNGFLQFLDENKAWWITPIVIVLGLVAYLVFFADGPGSEAPEAAQPFVYDVH